MPYCTGRMSLPLSRTSWSILTSGTFEMAIRSGSYRADWTMNVQTQDAGRS